MDPKPRTRRDLLRLAGATAAALSLETRAAHGRATRPARTTRVKFGLASYSLRKFDLDRTIEMTKRVGLKYICLKSFHLPLDSTPDRIAQVVKKLKDAGLVLYAGGVISMRTQADIDRAFEYAKAAGMRVIVAGNLPPALLPVVDAKVKQYDIKVAIHNHGPGDRLYPTPDSAYARLKPYDKRIGFCHDIGHTQRLGIDPVASTLKVADRLHDIHVKDVTGPTARDHGCEIGRGVIDIPGFLRTLLKIKYAGVVAIEYEKDADDPLPGLAESAGYLKGALAAITA